MENEEDRLVNATHLWWEVLLEAVLVGGAWQHQLLRWASSPIAKLPMFSKRGQLSQSRCHHPGPLSSEQKRHVNFFHLNFLCLPSSPGLSQGQTRWNRASTVQNKEKTRVCPRFSPGFSRGQARWNPWDKPGSSQDQPDKKVYVYVPFSCLIFGDRISHFYVFLCHFKPL